MRDSDPEGPAAVESGPSRWFVEQPNAMTTSAAPARITEP